MNTGIKGMGSAFERIPQSVGEMGRANVTGQSTNEAILGFELGHRTILANQQAAEIFDQWTETWSVLTLSWDSQSLVGTGGAGTGGG